MASSSQVNLWTILSESKRILNAHSRHFLALSVLFLLPNSFFTTVYPSLFHLITNQPSSPHTTISLLRSDTNPNPKTILVLTLAYVIVITIFNLLSIGAISYSIVQGFYGRPVKFVNAVKSSFVSFLPLLVTLISTNLIALMIFLTLGFIAYVSTKLIQTIILIPGLEIPFVIVMVITSVVLLKLQIDWLLVWVIVVVESVYGLTPLKRSNNLTKGMKFISLCVILFFGVTQSVIVWISKSLEIENGGWSNAVNIVVTSAVLTVLNLFNVAASTVMYMYCKAVQGELALEIVEEFGREYVSLPFDVDGHGKGPHLISVAYNNV